MQFHVFHSIEKFQHSLREHVVIRKQSKFQLLKYSIKSIRPNQTVKTLNLLGER